MSSTEICIKLFTRRRILSAEIGDVRSQLAWFLSDNSGIMFDVKKVIQLIEALKFIPRETVQDAGMSLRAGGRGLPPATKRVAPGFFHWKIGEK